MDFESIRVERADGVATITLHRPDRLNAWTPVMGREMTEAFRAADRDPDVRAVILTGAGRAFCAGADMDFFAGQIRSGGGTGGAGGDGPGRVEEFPALMQHMSKPTIAAINGYALGVGCTMTLLCDVRIAATDAKMGFLFSRMGVMAELGSTFLLPRLVGIGRACELMFTGKQYPAADLERIGLLNHVVAGDELLGRATALAREMAQCAPLSLALTRRALYQGLSATFEAQVRHEAYALEYLYRSHDHAEAVAAFKEKRAPRFDGALASGGRGRRPARTGIRDARSGRERRTAIRVRRRVVAPAHRASVAVDPGHRLAHAAEAAGVGAGLAVGAREEVAVALHRAAGLHRARVTAAGAEGGAVGAVALLARLPDTVATLRDALRPEVHTPAVTRDERAFDVRAVRATGREPGTQSNGPSAAAMQAPGPDPVHPHAHAVQEAPGVRRGAGTRERHRPPTELELATVERRQR